MPHSAHQSHLGDMTQQPLNWEASATATHPQITSSLPSEVETCLKNARFVCSSDFSLHAQTQRTNHRLATSRHLRRSLPSHLTHELYVSTLDPLPPKPSHHHDDQPFLQKDPQFDKQSPCIPPRSRLGVASTPNPHSRPCP